MEHLSKLNEILRDPVKSIQTMEEVKFKDIANNKLLQIVFLYILVWGPCPFRNFS